jgi:hypothetical protein
VVTSDRFLNGGGWTLPGGDGVIELINPAIRRV